MDYRDLTEKDCMYQDRLIREYRQKLSGLPEAGFWLCETRTC